MTTHSARSLLSLPLLLVAVSSWFGCPSAWADTLAWDANPAEELVTGYRVHWGAASRTYTGSQDVGPVLGLDLSALTPPLYFAVTAYDGTGAVSGYSEEVLWQTSGTDPPTIPAPACCGAVVWSEIEEPPSMSVTRPQSLSATGTNPTATFGTTPTSGNLLVAIAAERSGVGHAGMSISGTGWTKRIGRDHDLSSSDYRRSMAVWTKVAGASEATAITITLGNTARVVISEYEDSGGATWTFREKADNDNGSTASATTISSGTTASVAAGDLVEIAAWYCKKGATATTSTGSFTGSGDIGNDVSYDTSTTYTRVLGTGFGTTTVGGAKSSTGTYANSSNDTNNNGLMAGILVFELAAAGDVTITASIDALLSRTASQSASIDALVSQTASIPLSVDALLSALGTVAADLDAVLQGTLTTGTGLDALVSGGLARSLSLDALLQGTGLTAAASLDAVLSRLGITATTGLDAILQSGSAATLSLDALLQGTGLTTAASLDALLSRLGITATLSLDALLSRLGVTASASLDALLARQGLTVAASLDAILITTGGGSVTTSLDALLQGAGITCSLSFDAYLQRVATTTASLDALLAAAGSAATGLDAVLSGSGVQSLLFDALVSASGSGTTSLDALLSRLGQTAALALDAVLINSLSASLGLDALLQGTLTAATGLDAVLVSSATGPRKTLTARDRVFYLLARPRTYHLTART